MHHLTPDVLDLHLSLVGGMAIQLLQALEAMCAAGIAHRDVCPDNVVMDVGEPLQGREVQMKVRFG